VTSTTPEAGPLPDDGPATLDGVKLQLGIDAADVRDDPQLQVRVDAVNAQVRRWPVAQVAAGQPDWAMAADVVLGANMLAARLYRRKNSPDGVLPFGAEGAVYVQRNDPDVAQLLGLGTWAKPVIG